MKRLTLLRTAIGVGYLLAPGRLLGWLAPRDVDPRACTVLRLLGVRQLAQALLCARDPTAAVARWGAGADAAHAGSMLALALFDRRRRRAASIDACIAATLAVAGFTGARALQVAATDH